MANKINYTGSSKVIKRICESLNDVIDNGGGETVVLINKNITQNGTYNAVTDDSADGYREVTVNVPNTYSAGDEGKVVNNGALVSQTSQNISANGTYNTTTNNEVVVNVPTASLISKNVSANGTYNASSDSADGYSSVVVNVPNTYSAGDEGKVVDNGALASQTSRTITSNGTYDTTKNNEVVVNVSGGGGTSWDDIDSFSNPFSLYQANAISLSNYSFTGYALDANLAMTAGSPYEGCIIALNNLTAGNFYKLQFDFQISGNLSWYNNYGWGFKVTQNADSGYSSTGNWPCCKYSLSCCCSM